MFSSRRGAYVISQPKDVTQDKIPVKIRDDGRRKKIVGNSININEIIVKYEKSKEAREQILKALKNNDFLTNILKDSNIQEIIDVMQPKPVLQNEIILKQGEFGDYVFVSESGNYEIIIDNNIYNTITEQTVFGELAILYDNPRLATIKATSDGHVWMLHRDVFKALTIRTAVAEDQERIEFLKNVPIVNKASHKKLQKISNLLKDEFFKTGTEIVTQGDKGDKFYIIKAGTATVNIEGKGNVNSLQKGNFFGEKALLQDDSRQATVIADSPGVHCLVLSRQNFADNLGNLEDFLKTNEEEHRVSHTVKSEYEDLSLSQFKRRATLGIGGFGRVELVQSKTDKKLVFALKYMKKVFLREQDQREHCCNERNIQISCRSNFLVRLYRTYQDKRYVYFLMEPCLGGELHSILIKNRCFSEETAKFYAACILEALTYLHKRDYIYRDLKPENIMIDSQGYVKLTDFGIAKYVEEGTKTYTFCGTPEYVPPEIINSTGYGKGVDCWEYGIFIYEMLAGRTPFYDPNHNTIYKLIAKGIEQHKFNSKVTGNAKKLITNLCRASPKDRIGNQRNGMEDIANHKWFSGYDFKKLRDRKIKPPHVPILKSNIDTRHFKKYREDTDIPPVDSEEFWEGF